MGVDLDPGGTAEGVAERRPHASRVHLAPSLGVGRRERPPLAHGRLVDLDDACARLLPGVDFFGDRLRDGPEQAVVGHAGRPKLQFTIVTGPVSIPLTGLLVAACATFHSRTVMGSEIEGGAAKIGGRTIRLP